MTLRDVGELVESDVSSTEHERGPMYLKHDGRPGFPGRDWMTFYLKRNKLSPKEATKLGSARYNDTKNPFVIFHYFDILEEATEKLKIRDCPDLIWNCSESGLPHEPKKCKVLSEKGQKSLQVSFSIF